MVRAAHDTAQRFAANVLAARAALQLDRGTVSARVRAAGFPKFSGGTVRLVEAGHRIPRLDEACAIAHALGLPLDRLITETPHRVKEIARQVSIGEWRVRP